MNSHSDSTPSMNTSEQVMLAGWQGNLNVAALASSSAAATENKRYRKDRRKVTWFDGRWTGEQRKTDRRDNPLHRKAPTHHR